MAGRMIRENERNIKSDDFLQENKNDFTGNTFATAQIAALKVKVAESNEASEEQIASDGNARAFYDIAEDANEKLKDIMDDVIDFAVTLADEIEGIEEKFRRVRTGGKRGRIARARVFAAEAEPHKALFIGRGLEGNFIEALNTNADALEQALANAVSETGKRVGSTDKKRLSIKDASKIVTSLDPIVRKRYRDNPAKLAAWIFASHVQRDAQPPQPTPPTPPSNPPV
jgi:hypothetical protein